MKTTPTTPAPRPIRVIAAEIRADWTNVYYGAEPYLDAMGALNTMDDYYFLDSAENIVARFLVNAGTWRGETARRIKSELRAMTTKGAKR